MELGAVFADIERDKAQLESDVVILVHHYQRDEVIRFADFRGDSLQLSRVAAEQRDAKYIVFCGSTLWPRQRPCSAIRHRSSSSRQEMRPAQWRAWPP